MSAPYDANVYRATILRHVDGDTTLIRAHGPWDIKLDMTVRWAGIDAPEMSTPEGHVALDLVTRWLPLGSTCTFRTAKSPREKFGRYLGYFFLPGGECVNDLLVTEGYARYYDGGAPMSILDTIKSLVTLDTAYTTPDAIRALSATPAVPMSHADLFTRGPVQTADWSGVGGAQLEQAARVCVTVYACATFLADAVAESPLRVYRLVDGEPEPDHGHRARLLIANPNPVMSEAEFMTLTVMTMAFTGYAVVEKVRSAGGLPVELWPLRPDWLHRERTNDGSGRFVYRVPAQEPRVIERDDLLIIPYRHDHRQASYGVSPLHIAAREVGIDAGLTDLLKVFLDAGGIPPYVLEMPNDTMMEKAEIEALQLAWQQKYGGAQAYGKLPVTHSGMKIVTIGHGMNDMAWPDLRTLTELKIAQAFRVPSELIEARAALATGGLETTRAQGAMERLQRFGAAPLRTRIDGAFSRGLLADFTGGDPSYTVEFDISAILSLQEDRDALHLRVREDFRAGLLTLGEARLETGRADLGADGDVFAVPMNVSYLRAPDLAGAIGEEPPPATITASAPRAIAARNRRYRDTKAMGPHELEVRASVVATTARDRRHLEERATRRLRVFWREQGRRVIAGLPKGVAGPVDVKDALQSWDEEEARLREVVARNHDEAGRRAFANVAQSLNVGIAWDLANPNIARVMDLLGLRIVDISETTRLDVVRVVTAGLEEGLGVDKIAADLTDLFEQTYRSRAVTVARTETMTSYNLASTLGYQESGVVAECELLDNADHTESYGASDGLTCAERDGLIVPLADVPMHVEAEHPNGQLSVAPILTSDLGT